MYGYVCVFPCFVHLSLKLYITVLLSMLTAFFSSPLWLCTLFIYSLSLVKNVNVGDGVHVQIMLLLLL